MKILLILLCLATTGCAMQPVTYYDPYNYSYHYTPPPGYYYPYVVPSPSRHFHHRH